MRPERGTAPGVEPDAAARSLSPLHDHLILADDVVANATTSVVALLDRIANELAGQRTELSRIADSLNDAIVYEQPWNSSSPIARLQVLR